MTISTGDLGSRMGQLAAYIAATTTLAADASTRLMIRAMLGLSVKRRVGVASRAPVPRAESTDPSPDEPPPSELPPTTLDEPPARSNLRIEPLESMPGPPAAWATAQPISLAGEPEPPPIEPLLPPARLRTLLVDALHTRRPCGIDVDRAVERIARGQRVVDWPRRTRRSLRAGVQVLVDPGAALEPFLDDRLLLLSELQRLFRPDQIDRASAIDDPGAPADDRLPTRPGAPILVLSDAGLARGPAHRQAIDWRRFARERARSQQRVVLILPFERDRWPARLTRSNALELVEWCPHRSPRAPIEAPRLRDTRKPDGVDRILQSVAETTPGALALAEAACLLADIEPWSLRRLRLALHPQLPPSAESDLWHGPLIAQSGLSRALLRVDVAERLRADLGRRPARLERVWAATQAMQLWRSPLTRCVETLHHLDARGADDRAIEAELAPLMAAFSKGDAQSVAWWSQRNLPRLPVRVRRSPLAAALAVAAGSRIGFDLGLIDRSTTLRIADLRALLALSPRMSIRVRLEGDTLAFAVDGPGEPLEVPQTWPILLEVDMGSRPRSVVVPDRVPAGASPVAVTTMDGQRHGVYFSVTARSGKPAGAPSAGQRPRVQISPDTAVQERAIDYFRDGAMTMGLAKERPMTSGLVKPSIRVLTYSGADDGVRNLARAIQIEAMTEMDGVDAARVVGSIEFADPVTDVDALARRLTDGRDTILQLVSHASSDGSISISDRWGNVRLAPDALARIVKGTGIKVVIASTNYGAEIAKTLVNARAVGIAIGYTAPLSASVALQFSCGFYRSLILGKSPRHATADGATFAETRRGSDNGQFEVWSRRGGHPDDPLFGPHFHIVGTPTPAYEDAIEQLMERLQPYTVSHTTRAEFGEDSPDIPWSLRTAQVVIALADDEFVDGRVPVDGGGVISEVLAFIEQARMSHVRVVPLFLEQIDQSSYSMGRLVPAFLHSRQFGGSYEKLAQALKRALERDLQHR